ncbi:hypothetical protein LR69_00372 [Geobacillus sp. BCO2]|nr:hypothetical protein LR69_00372 [Geobacillus sp. BCO2]
MELYQHFRKEEHPFIDQVLEWKEMVSRQYAPKLTDFLDPREQQIVQSIAGGAEDVRAFFSAAPRLLSGSGRFSLRRISILWRRIMALSCLPSAIRRNSFPLNIATCWGR